MIEHLVPAFHIGASRVPIRAASKPQIALELVERAVEMEIPFRAVVGRHPLYGEHRKLEGRARG